MVNSCISMVNIKGMRVSRKSSATCMWDGTGMQLAGSGEQ